MHFSTFIAVLLSTISTVPNSIANETGDVKNLINYYNRGITPTKTSGTLPDFSIEIPYEKVRETILQLGVSGFDRNSNEKPLPSREYVQEMASKFRILKNAIDAELHFTINPPPSELVKELSDMWENVKRNNMLKDADGFVNIPLDDTEEMPHAMKPSKLFKRIQETPVPGFTDISEEEEYNDRFEVKRPDTPPPIPTQREELDEEDSNVKRKDTFIDDDDFVTNPLDDSEEMPHAMKPSKLFKRIQETPVPGFTDISEEEEYNDRFEVKRPDTPPPIPTQREELDEDDSTEFKPRHHGFAKRSPLTPEEMNLVGSVDVKALKGYFDLLRKSFPKPQETSAFVPTPTLVPEMVQHFEKLKKGNISLPSSEKEADILKKFVTYTLDLLNHTLGK